jgi:hypothetical protein
LSSRNISEARCREIIKNTTVCFVSMATAFCFCSLLNLCPFNCISIPLFKFVQPIHDQKHVDAQICLLQDAASNDLDPDCFIFASTTILLIFPMELRTELSNYLMIFGLQELLLSGLCFLQSRFRLPAVLAAVPLDGAGLIGRAAAPSGASCGQATIG